MQQSHESQIADDQKYSLTKRISRRMTQVQLKADKEPGFKELYSKPVNNSGNSTAVY